MMPGVAGHSGDRVGPHHVEWIAVLQGGTEGGLGVAVTHFPQIGVGQTVAVTQFVTEGGESK